MKRKKKKSVAPHGKFAQIPEVPAKKVLASLSAPEFRVWFALCLQNQHWSNGTGKLCRAVIREFHLGSQRVVTSATKKLLDLNYIVRTRESRQRTCALYGVTYLPLNADALAEEGLTDVQIRTVQARFAAIVCDTNRGSTNSATTREAQVNESGNRGSANRLRQPLAILQGKRISSFAPPLALPQGNTSKKSPYPIRLGGHSDAHFLSEPTSPLMGDTKPSIGVNGELECDEFGQHSKAVAVGERN